eukprot:scaffold3974_cov59-Phaeocystis_antarctica.AAC.1
MESNQSPPDTSAPTRCAAPAAASSATPPRARSKLLVFLSGGAKGCHVETFPFTHAHPAAAAGPPCVSATAMPCALAAAPAAASFLQAPAPPPCRRPPRSPLRLLAHPRWSRRARSLRSHRRRAVEARGAQPWSPATEA